MIKGIIVIVLSLCLVLPAMASPVRDLKLVGQGEMQWLFWKLYDVRLFSPDGQYREGNYPLALSIRYARDIESQHLIEATIDEWQRMELVWQPEWVARLGQLWPSVKPGDELTLLAEDSGISHFYYNDVPLGKVSDPGFTSAFLAIWLSIETREPALRRQLLGL